MSGNTYYPPSGIYSDNYKKDTRIVKTKKHAVLAFLGLVLLFLVPVIPGINSPYLLRLFIGAGIAAIICLGLNILTGYCGQLNVGQSSFVMVGAFTAGLLNYNYAWPLWLTVIPAGLAASIAGVIFGAPSVRLKGLYLALTTLAAQIVLTWVAAQFHRPRFRRFQCGTAGYRGFLVRHPGQVSITSPWPLSV